MKKNLIIFTALFWAPIMSSTIANAQGTPVVLPTPGSIVSYGSEVHSTHYFCIPSLACSSGWQEADQEFIDIVQYNPTTAPQYSVMSSTPVPGSELQPSLDAGGWPVCCDESQAFACVRIAAGKSYDIIISETTVTADD